MEGEKPALLVLETAPAVIKDLLNPRNLDTGRKESVLCTYLKAFSILLASRLNPDEHFLLWSI